jgi:2-oxoglutarate dehydrogenase E1 component
MPIPKKVKRVLFCSGKIYFDLNEFRSKNKTEEVAVIRLEPIYPLLVNQLEVLKTKYGNAAWIWVQEEPLNMGAASFLRMNLTSIQFDIISRTASAATATGFSKVHAAEQETIIKKAFTF